MAKAFEEQRAERPDLDALTFEERRRHHGGPRGGRARHQAAQAARLKFAALRQDACVEDIDLRTPRGLDRPACRPPLVAGDWIDRHQNYLRSPGPAASARAGWPARWATRPVATAARSSPRVPRLFEALALARGDGRHARLLKTLGRIDLLILDDWGLSGLTPPKPARSISWKSWKTGMGEASTLVTSQIPVDQWHDVIGDPTLADAILDRLVHNAHRLTPSPATACENSPPANVSLTTPPRA